MAYFTVHNWHNDDVIAKMGAFVRVAIDYFSIARYSIVKNHKSSGEKSGIVLFLDSDKIMAKKGRLFWCRSVTTTTNNAVVGQKALQSIVQ